MSSPIRPPLTVTEGDGNPSGRPINKIVVSNGTLSINGTTATITTGGGGGGSGTVTSVGTSQVFITISNPTTTPSISIGNASGAATGVLTAANFNTFNAKQEAITLTTTGTSGAATFSANTLNIPQYSSTTGTVTSVGLTETGSALAITGSPVTGSGTFNIAGAGTSSQVILGDLSLGTLTSGTVTGTGVANQVSYWTAASVQAGSTGLTYDSATGDLTVGGYVEVGTKVTTPSGTALTLEPGGTSSGSIAIADGANGQISLTPNGTGKIKLDGVELDNSAIATNYVLKATSTTSAGWAAESGGGSGIGGSITDNQVAVGSSTSDEIEGSASYTATLGGSGSVNSLKFGHSDGTTGYTRLRLNGNNAYLEFRDQNDNQKGAIGFQSTQGLKFYAKAGGLGATEALRITPDDEWILNGSNVGTSGQVLTSGGSGAAVSWTTPSGGGLKIPNSFGTTLTGTFGDGECLGLGIGLGTVGNVNPNSSSWANGLTRIRPHIMMQTGTLSTAKIWVSAQPTGGVDQNWIIGMWNMGTDNKVGTLKATATIICLEGGSTGIIPGTWTAETGQDLSVANGETYFIGYYSTYSASSTAVKVYFVQQNNITAYPARRPNNNTGATSTPCRVYGSSGDPSSLGDNPTMTGADTQSTLAWPFMWYEVT